MGTLCPSPPSLSSCSRPVACVRVVAVVVVRRGPVSVVLGVCGGEWCGDECATAGSCCLTRVTKSRDLRLLSLLISRYLTRFCLDLGNLYTIQDYLLFGFHLCKDSFEL